MKKLSLMGVVCGLAACASATSYVYFSSVGPDTYADGTTVLDGEVYALVWSSDGTFDGFNADGTLVDSSDQLVSAAACAKDGKCPPLVYILEDDQATLATTGELAVYLLDTRVTATAADGTTTTTLAGVNSDGELSIVSTASKTTATITAASTTANAEVAAVTADAASATAVPADTPNPTISAVKVAGGKVYVTVVDTVPYLKYGISAGKTPSQLDQTDLVTGINGVKDEDITLIVNDPEENRFFKVIRK